MDILFLVGMLIFGFTLLGCLVMSVYTYIQFSHEKESFFPGSKYAVASVISSIFISVFTGILLCIDLMKGLQSGGTTELFDLDIRILWNISLFLSIVCFVMNFFWLNYYRYHNPYNNDPEDLEISKRVKTSAWFIGKIILGVFAVILPMTFIYGGRVTFSYKVFEYQPSKLKFSNISRSGTRNVYHAQSYTVKLVPNLVTILSGPFVFYGLWLFMTLVSFGMATTPIYFFTIWIKRPKKPDPEDMVMSDIILQEMSSEAIETLKDLVETQEEIEEIRKEDNHDKKALHIKIDTLNDEIIEVQKQLVLFEEIHEIKKRNHNILDENPLKYFSSLIMGFISTFISFTVILDYCLSVFYRINFWEKVMYKVFNTNFIFLMLLIMFLCFYIFFALFRGYESLGHQFPNILGFNQMQGNRTWFDTWCIMANFIIPVSWAIIAFLIRLCPHFMASTYINRILHIFTMHLEYIYFFKTFQLYKAVCLFFFVLGLVLNVSKVFRPDKLSVKLEETKNNLKNNQLRFYKDTKKKRRK